MIENLQYNIDHCDLLSRGVGGGDRTSSGGIIAKGYLWGADVQPLLSTLPLDQQHDGFDVLILADLLFNHSEHGKLLQTIRMTLKKQAEARALVFFTPYRPWLLEKDLAFFDIAREGGFEVEKVLEKVMEEVMFEEDPGVSFCCAFCDYFVGFFGHKRNGADDCSQDELLRRTVFGYELRWKDL